MSDTGWSFALVFCVSVMAEVMDTDPPIIVPPPMDEYFIVPERLAEAIKCDTIRFYRPRLNHTLTQNDRYAVRCNESYLDIKAALEGERAYVRLAALKAQEIWFYRCNGKPPIIIIGNFSCDIIKAPGSRAIDDAANRCVTVKPTKSHHIQIDYDKNIEHYRITGPLSEIMELSALATADIHWSTKQHHVEGWMVAHAFLSADKARELFETGAKVMFDKVTHITTSTFGASQITMRSDTASYDETLAVAMAIRSAGGWSHLRTHRTLRATLAKIVDADTLQELKKSYPGWKIFSDTPISAWAGNRQETQREERPKKPKQQWRDVEVQQALSQQKPVVKISADHMPNPEAVKAICHHFNAQLIKIVQARFTDSPMSFVIAFNPSTTEAHLNAILSEPFAIDDQGLWYATRVQPWTDKGSK